MSFELKVPKRETPPAAKVRKRRRMKTASGLRFVLFLGDEGAILLHMKGATVQSRQFVPDASEGNLAEIRQTIQKDPKAPLLLVVDTMDQSYMQQTLPPVSTLSINKLIKRRLDRDFSGNDIKGAILLGREKGGRKDWNFLMVALEKSPQLTSWMDFIQQLPNRFDGIYIAAIEAEMTLARLEDALDEEPGDEPVEWKFFVSHNKVGGFRQVILRNNRILFTRLAQPVGDSSAEVIAGSIEQEMLSTIEYMKRLGFSAQNKLAIYIVTSEAIKTQIDASKFKAHAFRVLTPFEVAERLGLEGAAQPTDQFGDVVLAASIGASRKHVLKLSSPQTKKVDYYYQLLIYQRLLMTLAILGLVGHTGYLGYDIISLMNETGELTDVKSGEQRGLEKLRQDISGSSIDVEKASDLIDAYQQLLRERLSPLPMIKKLEPILKEPVWIKSFEWTIGDEERITRGGRGTPGVRSPVTRTIVPTASLALTIEFPQEAGDMRLFKVVSKRVLATVKDQFPGFEVKYPDLKETSVTADKLEIRSADTGEEKVAKSLDVKLLIRGDLALLDSLDKPPVATSAPAITQPTTAPATPAPMRP